jgi:DNA-binding transcriptional LysR family regulator
MQARRENGTSLELSDLRFLLELAASRSLTLAAVKLELTQAAASRRLAALESQLGGRLFNRTGRGLAPTEMALRLLPQAQALLEGMDSLRNDALAFSGKASGEVHLGVLPSAARRVVTHVFEQQRRLWPDVRLRVHVGFTGTLDEALKSGALDLAVLNRYGPSPSETEFFLEHVDLVLVARRGDRVTASAEVPFSRLANLPLILPPAPNALRVVIEQHARSRQVPIVEVLSADSLPLLIQLAVAQDCYTIVPASFVAEQAAGHELQASRIVEPQLRRAVTLGLSTRRPSTAAVMEVSRCIREYFQR